MTTVRTSILVALVLSVGSAAFGGQPAREVFLPTVAGGAAADGATLSTDVWVTNVGTQEEHITFYFLAQGRMNADAGSFTDTLAPGATRSYQDVLSTGFGLASGAGAARIVADGPVTASEKVRSDGATTLYLAASPAEAAIGLGETTVVQGLSGFTGRGGENFFLVEASGQAATVRVALLDAQGSTLRASQYVLQPYEALQPDLARLIAAAPQDAVLQAEVVAGPGRVIVTGTPSPTAALSPGAGAASPERNASATPQAVTVATSPTPTSVPPWDTAGNAGTACPPSLDPQAVQECQRFLGTTDDSALELHVNGQRALRLEPTGTDSPNLIAGSLGNSVPLGIEGAVIGGGGSSVKGANRVTSSFGTIGGGLLNTVSGVGGVVPGGTGNTAAGATAFAAGTGANAANAGSFVWNDGSAGAFGDTAANQFLVHAAGGLGVNTSHPRGALDVNGTAVVNGFRLPNGSTSGYVLTSDPAGNGAWRPAAQGTITGVTAGTGLIGGGTLGNVALSIPADGVTAALIGSSGAAGGRVLTADGSGGAAWQPLPAPPTVQHLTFTVHDYNLTQYNEGEHDVACPANTYPTGWFAYTNSFNAYWVNQTELYFNGIDGTYHIYFGVYSNCDPGVFVGCPTPDVTTTFNLSCQ